MKHSREYYVLKANIKFALGYVVVMLFLCAFAVLYVIQLFENY